MPILRKTDLQTHVYEFDDRCEKLRHALIGESPNSNVYDQYSLNPDDFKRDFVEINLQQIDYSISDLSASLKKLKAINRISAKRLGSAK